MGRGNLISQKKRDELRVKSFTFFTLFYLANAVLYFFIDVGVLFYITLVTGSAVGALGYFTRKNDNVPLITHAALSICFVSHFFVCLLTYQSSLLCIIYLAIFPLVALLFVDNKGFIFWSFILVLTVIVLPLIGPSFPYKYVFPEESKSIIIFPQIVAAFVTMSIILSIYRSLLLQSMNALENKTEKLEIAQKKKDQFFASISHELRTPMNAILGISDLLESDIQKNANLLGNLRTSSNHLLTIINDLLDFSKMKAGKLTLNEVNFNLRSNIEAIFNIVIVIVREKKQNMTMHIDETLPSLVVGDQNRLTQIIVNVLSNAAKYTPEQGNISIEYRDITTKSQKDKNSCGIRIIIEDDGIGMNDETLKNVYKDYFRSDRITNDNISGTGLGLYITKNLINTMNGSIDIYSQENQGTKVIIELEFPISSSQRIDNFRINETNPSILDNELNILVVDDNHLNLVVAQKQLERVISNKSQIVLAQNGKIALEKIKNQNFDIVLMDMKMPVMNGVEATCAIRNMDDPLKRNVPILAVSANVSEKDIRKCFECGMDEYISKPFELDALIDKISLLLNKNPMIDKSIPRVDI